MKKTIVTKSKSFVFNRVSSSPSKEELNNCNSSRVEKAFDLCPFRDFLQAVVQKQGCMARAECF